MDCLTVTLFVTGIGFILFLIVAGLIISIYSMILFFEACIASITATQILCQMEQNLTGFQCPKPWHYDSYLAAIDGSRTIATGLFQAIIGVMVVSLIVQIVAACLSGGKRQQYSSV